ncbi:MAG: sulfurtransferase [Candidatus Rokuibacteriota bacterium]|nr:MAG: sulfurtransferase [Candidatus Rokubacteria bacterium]
MARDLERAARDVPRAARGHRAASGRGAVPRVRRALRVLRGARRGRQARRRPFQRDAMSHFVDFVIRHGEALVFVYVFADQIGVPLPAVPALLAMGALAAVGKLNFALALGLSVVASLLADTIWYTLGRTRGSRVLRLLCKISLEPDSCVRRTEEIFLRYGVRSLVIAKFIPGLSTVAPPLAGMVGVGLPRFAVYSALAALLWAGTWGGLGYLAGDALQRVTVESGRLGTRLATLVATAVVIYIVVKWVQRRRFLHSLRIARVSQEELKHDLDAGTAVFVVDLRSELDVAAFPFAIPGALRIAAEELERRHQDIPRDRDVIVYCS